MFQKIKKRIKLLKISGVVIAVIFVLHIGFTVFQACQIAKLQNTVEELQNR